MSENPTQRELEERFYNLTPEERAYRLRIIQQDSTWRRPPEKPKDKHIKEFVEKIKVKKHFDKHGKEVGVNSVEEYEKKTMEVLSNPDRVFVSLVKVLNRKHEKLKKIHTDISLKRKEIHCCM